MFKVVICIVNLREEQNRFRKLAGYILVCQLGSVSCVGGSQLTAIFDLQFGIPHTTIRLGPSLLYDCFQAAFD
jgi:hypothetical protein